MKLYIADTGPLLHLHEIGALPLLSRLGSIGATQAVASELLRHAPSLTAPAWPGWLQILQLSASARIQADNWIQAGLLHEGEAEAIACACESAPDAFLTDDAE